MSLRGLQCLNAIYLTGHFRGNGVYGLRNSACGEKLCNISDVPMYPTVAVGNRFMQYFTFRSCNPCRIGSGCSWR